ncbi:MAG: toll/interleukin-1 receptor domain-containing protein [Phycisphaerae bacterium]|nr:toll/interleukin-1 receptor domain-containing protein [Saprospiraceae bacterium]
MQMKPINVLLASVVEDKVVRDKLRKGLTPLAKTGIIVIGDENDILPGDVTLDILNAQLLRAEIIVLLVSTDALGSDYFYSDYMDKAVQRHIDGEAIVIPVKIGPCSLEHTPLKPIKYLPTDGIPMRQKNLDDAVYEVTEQIELVAKKRRNKKAFEGLIKDADDLFNTQQWEGSLSKFTSALAFWQLDLKPEKEEINQKIILCQEQIAKENEARQFESRKSMFLSSMKVAEDFRDQRNWSQAIKMYEKAHENWESGFEVDRVLVESRISECGLEIAKLENIADINPIPAPPVQVLEKEIKNKIKPSQSGRQRTSQKPIQKEVPTTSNNHKNSTNTKAPPSLPNIYQILSDVWERHGKLISYAVIALAFLIFITCIIPPKPNPISKKEDMAIQEARRLDTLPVWKNFNSAFPNGAYKGEANESIKRLEYRQDRVDTYAEWAKHSYSYEDIFGDIMVSIIYHPKDSTFYKNLYEYYKK